jgi:8-oxo-dGTP pyrophosphatase MutT (NUDIX family)
MEITCGTFVIDSKSRLLICHPTGDQINIWSIPKGWPDDDETYEEAAIRELEEETGLRVKDYTGKLEYVGEIPYQYKPKKLIAFSFFLKEEVIQPLTCSGMVSGTNIPEVDIIKWVGMHSARTGYLIKEGASRKSSDLKIHINLV